MTEIELAVPNKGRLREPTMDMLRKAGIIPIDLDEQALYARTVDPEIRLVFVRAADVPKFVEEGVADLGVTGYDFVVDSGADVEELLDLRYGSAKIVVAVPESSGIASIDDIPEGAKVATKLVNIARKFFDERGKWVEVIRISGAAEIMPHLGVSQVVVDVMSTGATLKTHGLRVIHVIMETSARLIGNRESISRKRAKVREIVMAIESVMRAQGKKLIMMNVPQEVLSIVTMILPAMTGPTVAKVEAPEPMWEVYSVVDEDEVYRVVSAVKKAGARDILVIPIERIIP